MSRRLDISALLCNDDDDQPPPRPPRPPATSSPVLPRRPPAQSFPPAAQGAFVGFDALVHAATEERRRLSGGDLAQHHVHHHQYTQPQHHPQQLAHHHHQQPPPQRLSPQIRRSPWQEEQQYGPPPRQPQSPLQDPRASPIDAYKSPPPRHHPFDERSSHQMRQFQIIEDQKRKQELEFFRHQDLERRRQVEAERARMEELERAKSERQAIERERRALEEERRRVESLTQQLKQQEAEAARRREEEEREERRRREAERQRLEDEQRRALEREVAARREAQERHQQLQMQRIQEEQQQQQRIYEMHERQRRQQALQQAQQEQQQPYFHHQQQQAPQHLRNYEAPPRIEIPPGPQHPVRKIEQSPPSKPQSQSPNLPHAHPDQRPAKKPRYSDSPSLAPMVIDDKDRIARERERMTVGEIGYGRIESPIVPPPSSTSSTPSVPRRPGSGTGVRRPVSVSDLLSPEPQPPLPTPVDPHQPPLRIISRDKEPAPAPHHHHRILSPLGRRSPPGSQAGRAKAARKSEEHATSLHTIAPSISASSSSSASLPPAVTSSHPPPPPPASTTLPTKKPVVKEEHVRHQKMEELPSPMLMDPKTMPPPTANARESMGASHPAPAPPPTSRPSKERLHHSPQQQQGDAHDWFLEQIDQASPPAKHHSRHAPVQRTRSPSVPTQRRTTSPVIQVKKQSPSPVIEDVDNALEQELEELLAEVEEEAETSPKEEAMDVDSVVAELVAETLEGDDEGEDEIPKPNHREHEAKEQSMPLAADVDDELLSLIDDKPSPPASSSSARRASGSSTSVTTSFAHPVPRAVKQGPPSVKTSGAAPSGSATSPVSSLLTPVARPEASKPKSERGSMPPPPAVGKKEKDHEGKRQEGAQAMVPASMAASSKKKKDATGTKKPKAKATVTDSKGGPSTTPDASQDPAQAKPRPKATKKKATTSATTTKEAVVPTPAPAASSTASSSKPPAATKPANAATSGSRKHASVSASRSRSTSVMPTLEDDGTQTRASSVSYDRSKAEKQEEEEESDAANEDDRLYCVCKTKYDEGRCMIACDRCDEWYHLPCVGMEEGAADLVDQFFCPPCITKNSHLDLKTTYKQRCLWGQKCPDPDSPRACHKPARGAFSKYCSDECGVKYMQSRIDTWAKKGGKKEKLWDSVKGADRREGVVVRIEDDDANSCRGESRDGHLKPSKPAKSKGIREKERLSKLLEQIAQMSNELKKGMEVLAMREKLLEMAGDRAENVRQCGWDQRLCYEDEEWAANGQSVLESYDDRDMDVDGQSDSGDADWWCSEDTGCSRHMGWQTTRFKDICKEKEKKEEALQKLHARDSLIRKQLEDLANPPLKKHGAGAAGATSTHHEKNGVVKGAALVPNAKMSNGHGHKSKASAGGDALKKGKKRKAPSS